MIDEKAFFAAINQVAMRSLRTYGMTVNNMYPVLYPVPIPPILPAIHNSILWNNQPQEILDMNYITSGPYIDYNIPSSVAYCDIKGGHAGLGNIDTDPRFVDPCNGDYYLLLDSPCIDTGDSNYIAEPNETDIDGNPRIVNDRIDMGAYEFSILPEPTELLDILAQDIIDLGLHQGTENSLLAKLDTAIKKLEGSNEDNNAAAINSLQAFISAVEAQAGKKIPQEDADTLITAAQQIIDMLNSQ